MLTLTGSTALGFYAASLLLYVWHLYSDERAVGRLATLLLTGALVAHYFALLERAHVLHAVPYEDLYGSMSLFGWFLGVTYLGLELYHRQQSVGPFVLPLVVILSGLSTIFAPGAPHSAPARGVLFALHVTTNILAYSAFTLSFVFSAIYLGQNRLLRGRRMGTVGWRMPSLELLERMTRSAASLGLITLALGMIFGVMVEHRVRGRYFSFDPKEIISVLILVVYAGYLWLERTTAWRGARASLLCLCNYLAVVFSYTIVNLFLSRFHRFF
jgi:HemX protein